MDRAINEILDQAYTQARDALLAEMKRLTRVAAYLYEHERIDGTQFEALFDGTLAPSPEAEKEWRSAKSKPRSWIEIEDLIATSAGSPPTWQPASAAQLATAHRRRAHPHSKLSPGLLLLKWRRTLRSAARPAD